MGEEPSGQLMGLGPNPSVRVHFPHGLVASYLTHHLGCSVLQLTRLRWQRRLALDND